MVQSVYHKLDLIHFGGHFKFFWVQGVPKKLYHYEFGYIFHRSTSFPISSLDHKFEKEPAHEIEN